MPAPMWAKPISTPASVHLIPNCEFISIALPKTSTKVFIVTVQTAESCSTSLTL